MADEPMWRRYLRLWGPDVRGDVEEEMEFHVQTRAEELMRDGVPEAEARRRAEAEFGDRAGAGRECEEIDAGQLRRRTRGEALELLRADVRFAFRGLRKNPGFALVAILTLALGIGANTAIFSLVRSVLLRPLPYADPAGVMVLWNRWTGYDKTWLSEPEVLDYRREVHSLEQVAAYATDARNLTGSGEPERVPVAFVTANTFPLLGIDPALGRTFTAEEDVPNGPNVAVLSYALWQRRFGGDPSVVGRTVRIDGTATMVVGVMPPTFKLPLSYKEAEPPQLFLPLGIDVGDPQDAGSHYLYGLARLRPGATAAQANAELGVIASRYVAEGRWSPQAHFSSFVVPAEQEVFGKVRPALLVLLGAVGFVLLIACANVANLLLARSDARRREMAVRAALGAGRRRILRQLLTESVFLALLGGGAGVLLATVALRALSRMDPAQLPRSGDVRIDWLVLSAVAVVAVGTGLLFGLVPALHASRIELVEDLREGGRGASAGRARQRSRRLLVVGEIALSVVLVIAAGLMIRSFVALSQIGLGFRPDGVLTARISLPSTDYPDSVKVIGFYRELLERARHIPGVQAAAASRMIPLDGEMGDWGIDVEGHQERQGESFHADWQVVTPGYFETMGSKLLRGRTLEESDREGAPIVAVIDHTMAETYWPGENPLGRRFHLGSRDQPWVTVVGVIEDERQNGLVGDRRTEMYIPHAQFSAASGGNLTRTMTVLLRTDRPAPFVFGRLKEEVHHIDPNLPVASMRSMDDVVAAAMAQPRFTMVLLGLFAALALSLAAIGIYGVVAYTVAQRTHEMGVRLALGAEPRRVVALVVRDGAVLAVAGVSTGVVASVFLVGLLRGLVYGVRPLDPVTFVATPLLLGAVVLLASYAPARRAARVDPVSAFRTA